MGTSGAFTESDGQLELQQMSLGGCYAPLVIDWAPQRRKSYVDWRTLTVTEMGSVVKGDQASAHRVRIGSHQLLIYRSLKQSEDLRACLGLHTDQETVIGTFDTDGEVSPLLIVE